MSREMRGAMLSEDGAHVELQEAVDWAADPVVGEMLRREQSR